MIRMLSNSYADEVNTNAQNLTVREIARRLDPDQFHTTLFMVGTPDRRLAGSNVRFLRFHAHGKAARFLTEALLGSYAVNFYVRNEWVDGMYLRLRPRLAPRQIAVYHVVSGMGSQEENPQLLAAQVAGITRSHVVACNSAHVADTVESRLGVRPPVVRNGVDFERFAPSERKVGGDRSRILFAGSLQSRKRPDAVLDAASRLPDADFTIIGSGPLRDQIATRAQRLPNVVLKATVEQSRLADEMRKADVFLLPSASPSSEGAPQVLAQAAATGLPVVAFSAYRPEAVIDGTSGFVVRDDLEMIERLSVLVAQPGLRHAMGSAGVSLTRERFDWNRIVVEWKSMIVEAVARTDRSKAEAN